VSDYVVDTGACIVANGAADVSISCELAAVRLLRRLQADGHVLVDDLGLILIEYARHLSHSGQPGVGDAFFRWLRDAQWADPRCTRVRITPRDDDPQELEEFPRDAPGLVTFDLSDRKFVAVALSHGPSARIAITVDSDWWDHAGALAAVGVSLDFLCPEVFAA
jgi:hypothetical protein